VSTAGSVCITTPKSVATRNVRSSRSRCSATLARRSSSGSAPAMPTQYQYQRCLDVYATARELCTRDVRCAVPRTTGGKSACTGSHTRSHATTLQRRHCHHPCRAREENEAHGVRKSRHVTRATRAAGRRVGAPSTRRPSRCCAQRARRHPSSRETPEGAALRQRTVAQQVNGQHQGTVRTYSLETALRCQCESV
jgi:hypothetical protein